METKEWNNLGVETFANSSETIRNIIKIMKTKNQIESKAGVYADSL